MKDVDVNRVDSGSRAGARMIIQDVTVWGLEQLRLEISRQPWTVTCTDAVMCHKV